MVLHMNLSKGLSQKAAVIHLVHRGVFEKPGSSERTRVNSAATGLFCLEEANWDDRHIIQLKLNGGSHWTAEDDDGGQLQTTCDFVICWTIQNVSKFDDVLVGILRSRRVPAVGACLFRN